MRAELTSTPMASRILKSGNLGIPNHPAFASVGVGVGVGVGFEVDSDVDVCTLADSSVGFVG